MIIDDKKCFFLLGFQKSGTSTIHEWLKQINSISLPDVKETHYFSKKSNYEKGIKWYLENFNVSKNQSKVKMIDSFTEQTEKFIEDLKESGDFVSASDTGEEDDDTTVRDGGFF